jgi:hypothetical protein
MPYARASTARKLICLVQPEIRHWLGGWDYLDGKKAVDLLEARTENGCCRANVGWQM